MAMGIALLGTAVGGLLVPLVVWGLESWGWRTMANVSGAVILALGLPFVQVIRHRPEQYGLLPDGRVARAPASGVGDEASPLPPEPVSFTARDAMRTRAFWFISLAHTASVLVVSVVMVHFVAYATTTLGYSLKAAAGIVTLQTVTNLLGRPLGGWAADRTSSRLVTMVAMLSHGVALLLLAFAQSPWMVIAFALLNGLAWGARVPVVVSMRAEYFGSRSFGAIMGLSSLVVTFGGVIAPIAAAWAYDATESYTLSFAILAVLAGLGSLFLLFLPKPEQAPPSSMPARSERAATHG